MNDKFSQRIRELRKEKGLNQDDLAKASGVSLPTISRYEKGNRDEPKLTIIRKISKYFNVSIDYLAGDSDERDSEVSTDSLITLFRYLNSEDKRMLVGLAKSLLQKEGKI
jgi:transcriptional regulator with XRE-family HTH domain